MSDDFEEILNKLNAGENPTKQPDKKNTVYYARRSVSENKKTKPGTNTVMEYIVPNRNAVERRDIDSDSVRSETDDK